MNEQNGNKSWYQTKYRNWKKNKRNTPRVKIHRSENMKGWEANLRYNYLNSIKTWEGIYIQNYPRYPICY